MIQTIDLIFHLGGKTDPMQLITAAQSAHNFTHFADLPNCRPRVSVFNIDARAWLDTIRSVIAVIRNIAGAVFDEVILRQEPRGLDHGKRGSEKLLSFGGRHVDVDGLEQPAIDKATARLVHSSSSASGITTRMMK